MIGTSAGSIDKLRQLGIEGTVGSGSGRIEKPGRPEAPRANALVDYMGSIASGGVTPMPAAKSAAGPAFRGIDDEAAIRSPRLDDVVLPQAIMQERGDHALPLHAEAIDTVRGCNREGIGPNEWHPSGNACARPRARDASKDKIRSEFC
jgi:hypothetical protein